MPIKPNKVKDNLSTNNVLNTIKSNASPTYQRAVPTAVDSDSVKAIGTIILNNSALKNEFISALVNRIASVIVTSKTFQNPWAMFKIGVLNYGEIIEEVFVNIANPHVFNPADSENTVYKREIPDVRAAYHFINYQNFYKTTISDDQLRQAFLSQAGVMDLISSIVMSLYTSANYDEFQTMKYVIAKAILDGRMSPITVGDVTNENLSSITSTIKATSNSFTFLSKNYNESGVYSYTPKNEQYIILNSKFDAAQTVEVLASAFNMDKAEFFGHRIIVDGFGDLDTERLNLLLSKDPNYEEIGSSDLELLNNIPGVLVDRRWFMIADNFYNFTENYNGEGLYWNYFYHVWKTFSNSPYANAAVFVSGGPTVTNVTVSPGAVTLNKGNMAQLSANVTTTNFAPKSVTWSSSSEHTTVSPNGLVTVTSEETSGSVTITATSTFDSGKTGKATITIPDAG